MWCEFESKLKRRLRFYSKDFFTLRAGFKDIMYNALD